MGLFTAAREMYCPNCGVVGYPTRITKGSFVVEVFLWLLFILPGVLYTVWRLTSQYDGCPSCRQAGMIPSDSPRARELRRADVVS